MNLRKSVWLPVAGTLLLLQPYRPYVVDGESMSPTLATGQWLLGDCRPHQIARGDVIVFRRGSDTMIKRVALLPGDRVERYRFLGEWKIPTNGRMRDSMVRRRLPRFDLTIPVGELYVVGDNLRESVDSRTYGTIPIADVVALIPKVDPTDDPWGAQNHLTKAVAAML